MTQSVSCLLAETFPLWLWGYPDGSSLVIPVCVLHRDKIELGLVVRERSQIGPVQTLQAWVGFHLHLKIDLLTHSHFLEEVLLGGQVQVGSLWKAEYTDLALVGRCLCFVAHLVIYPLIQPFSGSLPECLLCARLIALPLTKTRPLIPPLPPLPHRSPNFSLC